MKKLFSLIGLMALTLALSGGFSPALADCQPLYGGGQTCVTNFSFTINKMVQVPGKGGGQYVDNLSINDPKYSPSQNVNYEIIVTNTGSQTIPTINVTDTFPQFIAFVAGAGNFNSSNNTLTFTVSNLNPGQSQTFLLTAKTADANTLPNDQGITCVINQVKAVDSNGDTDSDSSQACIQKNVLPAVAPAPKIVATPATGPEMLPLLGLIPGALGGLMLRKKSKNIKIEGGEK
ncbi:MAG: DUF11 domain-containing protein [Patescibacteria group bacterium]|nr:DUF11 domain-containing protein [Patescibacteria group bacterium]